MSDAEFADKLTAFCADRFGEGELSGLNRLSGGASMESWAFDYGGREMVLRRLPEEMAERGGDADPLTAISLETQAELIELARGRGVTAPEVLAVIEERNDFCKGFVMVRAVGETLPHKILGNPDFASAEARLTEQCARELAAIHAIDPADLPGEIKQVTPEMLLAEQEQSYREVEAAIPIYDYAFHWLESEIPTPAEPKLLHADYRMGNLMIDADGISAVLDWELAHLGDPMEDLSYICTPSWRFGHYEKTAGGFDSAENLIAAYEKASGSSVERSRFDWWLLYNTLWWGIACLRMGHSYRDGTAHTLERTIIGRRASEVEIDLLLQFEAMRKAENRALDWAEPPLLPDSGEVGYAEIVNALIEWNKEKVMPGTEGHALFEARVANNALGIMQRQAAWGQKRQDAASERLAAIGTTHINLCAALRAGERDLDDDDLWNHLRLTALDRLSIDQPKYGGFRVAKERWLES
ncbi:MAG: phosphotransferase family protein [Sphingomonadaceae bacterium]|nr:phosphotransferase family protein [Sphingomonadaceae bacterium]